MEYKKEFKDKLNNDIKSHFPRVSIITPDMKTTHEGISRLVMLDRYSQKDKTLKTLSIGDLVIAKIKDDPLFPTMGLGYIKNIRKKSVEVQIEQEYINQIDPNINQVDGVISVPISNINKPLEIYYEQIAIRVGKSLGEGEKQEHINNFVNEIKTMNIVPAGRVLYGAGSGESVTYYNCFVMPMMKDSRKGIADHRKEVMEIMARGGGVGTNGSTLRPKDAPAKTVGVGSAGAVTWLNDLASLTDLIKQGGSRHGAQMIMLQDWHPDILEFIISKMQKPEVLQWISKNFENEEIKNLAKAKLRFIPISQSDKTMHEIVVENSIDSELIKKSKAILEHGGQYQVVNPNFLTGANISVGITKEFMEAVENKTDYELKFPDLELMTPGQKEYYDQVWHEIGDVRIWEKKGYPVKIYKKIKAAELWSLINFCATYSAEPGVFFIDRANEMTNATSYDQKVVCTNPCGEQPLAPYSVCNLAAINLSNMVNKRTGEILWNKLENTIKTSVRMQDNIVDETPYFLKANEKQAKGERRIGLGVMGLHDLLIWRGARYGSQKALKIIDKLFEKIATTAYLESIDIGKEKGAFNFFTTAEKFLESGFMKNMPLKVQKKLIKEKTIRNSHLLTIAPTGTTGTMVGVSTGLEPYFAFKYFRSGRLGKFMEVDQKIVKEYRRIRKLKASESLPEVFVSANELTPEEHANTQTTIQKWVDSSISKTVNAPRGYSVKKVEKIYKKLYKDGAKGGTVYVDGSRDAQVLSISKDDVSENKIDDLIDIKSKEQINKIQKKHSIIPSNKFNKNIGIKIGNICPICKEGTVEDLGGCNSCTNCGVQLKCEV